jgi:hypothetical protein
MDTASDTEHFEVFLEKTSFQQKQCGYYPCFSSFKGKSTIHLASQADMDHKDPRNLEAAVVASVRRKTSSFES